jgi:putative FmdB family regulatory protein
MPIYEYECGACGARFEIMQKFSDPAPASCSQCHASAIHKVLSPTAFVLKGSGWYATDYPSADRKQAESSEAKEAPKPAAPACGGGCAGNCPSKAGA